MRYFSTILTLIIFTTFIHGQVNIVRGPYLQLATESSIVIKWRTDNATNSRIIYGLSPAALTSTVSNGGITTEHEITLTGLLPDTKYYYSVGNSVNLLAVGPQLYFYTLPPPNTIRPYQFWVIGDCGSGDDNQRLVRNAYQNHVGGTRTDGIIMLGDNAYTFGTDANYQDAVFSNMYENIVCNTVMWPTPGNHDYYSGADATTQTGPYYDIFTLPKNGELGGVPSNTEAYYSFNIGNIHFISIDSYDSGRDSNNAMGTWIKQDLQNNDQEWTIAYWHHAPYTKGNHDSDNPFPWLDGELPEMREQIVPLMENGGVDLILCGHSHTYERSMLIDGHYGSSSAFNATHVVDNGSGNFSVDCPYLKQTDHGNAHQGTVYTVLGVSGKKDAPGSGWPHPVMHTATTDHLGSMILQVYDNRLDAQFLTKDNVIYDQFTIIKDAGGKQVVYACQGQPVTLHASYPTHNYEWNPGTATGNSLTTTPFFNTFYFGEDPGGCIKDTFQIIVIPPGSPMDTCNWTAGINETEIQEIKISPNPVIAGASVYISIPALGEKNFTAELIDIDGKVILYKNDLSAQTIAIPDYLAEGAYIIRIKSDDLIFQTKLMITR